MAFSLPSGLKITYLGHSTFYLTLPNGKTVIVDPWTYGNPRCPNELKDITSADLMLITHGHDDHAGDALPIAQKTGCTIVCMFELMSVYTQQGVPSEKFQPMNKGGSIRLDDLGVTITMTHALHSASTGSVDGERFPVYTGEPAGFVVTLHDSGFAFYLAGDTAVFSDMRLIAELYQPKLAFLPIGDRFTMGPREAAYATKFLPGVEAVVPIHYATFPLLSGTPEAFADELAKVGTGVEILVFEPGETKAG